ncbi:DUF4271 domain-containing protein [uncultured Algoriphagus sp.]|uniref:DUF4271 domain-containing protein n=1 Tax=uncultured Algoriphagus sp. TaxID=417365 RepID=UPI00258F6E27|nr:DUF4271 domain-containing protein [uncultured Algoriphagus sp.]
MLKKGLLLFLFSLCFLITSHGQVLEEYSNDWEENLVKNWFSSSDQLSQWIDIRQFPEAYLVMQIPGETMVFAGERLWFYAEQDTLLSRKVKDYQLEFGVDSLQIRLLGDQLVKAQALLEKRLNPTFTVEQKKETAGPSLVERDFERQSVRDFFIIALLICLFLLAGYRQAYPYVFFSVLSPKGLVTAEDFSEGSSLQKFFSFDILLFVLIVNILAALSGVFGLIFFRQDLIYAWSDGTALDLLLIWMVGAMFIFGLTVLKFVGIRITAFVFDLGRMEFSHFFYLLRLIVWVNLVFLLVIFFYLMNTFSQVETFLMTFYEVFFWMYLVGIAFLFLSMMNKLSFKKYHLFTYLCIAELVPFLILVKWIMDFGQY